MSTIWKKMLFDYKKIINIEIIELLKIEKINK